MKRSFFSIFANWAVYIFLTLLMAGILFASNILIRYLKKEEANHAKLVAAAQKFLNDESLESDPKVLELGLSIMQENHTIPLIVTDRFNNVLYMHNLPEGIEKDPAEVRKILKEMENAYPPIEVKMPKGENQYIFYQNSRLLTSLQYYPLVLALVLGGYILFSFWFLKTVKRTDEGYVWAGLAKETAHQIGTPLSSMMGWIEILKMENENNPGVLEIEKDIRRLTTISERFSKIGSVPELNDLNIKETLSLNYEYLTSRVSNRINFNLTLPKENILIPHSRILLSWVIENIVKNAVDAMKGEGRLDICLQETHKSVVIDIKDSGSGMTKALARNVFKPGFSTKKRGWGLGLSLARRAIKEYHKGDIKVLQTELNKGTTFRIQLNK